MFTLWIMVGGRWSFVMRGDERKRVFSQITGLGLELVDNEGPTIYRTTDGLWKLEG